MSDITPERIAKLKETIETLRLAEANGHKAIQVVTWNRLADLATDAAPHLIDEIERLRALESLVEADKLKQENEKLRALLPKAFDSGKAWMIGSHETFVQIHPDRDTWVADALKEIEQ